MNQLMEYKLAQYDNVIENFENLQTYVNNILNKSFSKTTFHPMQIIGRIKT